MNQLAKLISMQKGKTSEVPATRPAIRDEENPNVDAGGSPQQAVAGPVPSSSEGAAPPVAKSGGLGLKRFGTPAARGTGTRESAAPVLPKPAPSPADGADDSGNDDAVEFNLADIARLTDADAPVVERNTGSGFDDEIEATAPDRLLDPDVTPQQLLFIESLDSIYQVLNDPDLFGQSVRMIMMELQEFPEYKKLVSDQDVHTMIRAMRNTMGMARIRKQEKSRKTGTTRKTAANKKSQVSDEDMALLSGLLGGGFDD